MFWGNDWNHNGEYDFQDKMQDFFIMNEVLGIYDPDKEEEDKDSDEDSDPEP